MSKGKKSLLGAFATKSKAKAGSGLLPGSFKVLSPSEHNAKQEGKK